MRPRVTMREALANKALLAAALDKPSWAGCEVLLIAAAGEKLTPAERVEFQKLTGRDREPGKMIKEFAGLIGRR